MNKQIAFLALYLFLAGTLPGQVSTIIPPHARDSLAARDARSPVARRDRQRSLDSLAAGRERWALARVVEYQLQVHAECLCVVAPDSTPRLPLVIVRDGAIVGHAPGRQFSGLLNETTVDSLFASIERDLRDPGRVVRQLDLDARYGFPRDYDADTPPITDVWLHIHVDSFAVTHAKSQSERKPPAT